MDDKVKITEEKNMKMQELERYLDDGILDELYKIRHDTLSDLDYLRKSEEYSKMVKRASKLSTELFRMLDGLPEELEELKEDFRRKFDDYMGDVYGTGSFENELYYKIGVCDGLRMILEKGKIEKTKDKE